MPDLFAGVSGETPWEWAKGRRRWFTSAAKDTVISILSALLTALLSYSAGARDWPRALWIAIAVGLMIRVVPPRLETLYWLLRRNRVLLEEENERLRSQYEEVLAINLASTQAKEPELTLVFDPAMPQCIHDKVGVRNQTLRIFRVGIKHTGKAPITIRVRLVDMSPYEQGMSYRSHELLPSGHDFGTLTATVNPTTAPLVFFEVAGQLFPPGGPANSLHIRYAAKGLKYRHLSGNGPYRVVLGIDGPNAEDPTAFTLRRNPAGIWEMQKATNENQGQISVNIQRSRF